MANKHTVDKPYRVVSKDSSHLNTKVNSDGSKSVLQFTDDNNEVLFRRIISGLRRR